jgi:hypothetical protein
MSETPHTEPTSAADATESSAEPSPESDAVESTVDAEPVSHAKDSSAPRASRLSRWAAPAALLLSVIAIAGGAVGWFYPHKSASSAATYTDQQSKDAKKHMCETFVLVDRAVVRNSRLKNPPEGGPIGALSVATSARLAFYGGGGFLRDRVSLEPATPSDLAQLMSAMGSTLEELAVGYLAGAPDFTQDALRQNLDEKIKAIVEKCK